MVSKRYRQQKAVVSTLHHSTKHKNTRFRLVLVNFPLLMESSPLEITNCTQNSFLLLFYLIFFLFLFNSVDTSKTHDSLTHFEVLVCLSTFFSGGLSGTKELVITAKPNFHSGILLAEEKIFVSKLKKSTRTLNLALDHIVKLF